MPTPLDVILREGPQPGSRADLELLHRRKLGLDMQCRVTRPGKSVCIYAPGPKAPQIEGVILPLMRSYRRNALSSAPIDRRIMDRWASVTREILGDSKATLEDWFTAARAAIWADVRYNDDAPGTDTVKMPEALVYDGEGDCVSLTVALSALVDFLSDRSVLVQWRVGGSPDPAEPSGFDPYRHIWPVCDKLPVEMTVHLPVGQELEFQAVNEVQA